MGHLKASFKGAKKGYQKGLVSLVEASTLQGSAVGALGFVTFWVLGLTRKPKAGEGLQGSEFGV